MTLPLFAFVIAAMIFAGFSTIEGQDAAVPKIPPTLPTAVQDSLGPVRIALLASIEAHNNRVRDWKASCGSVLSDSPSYAACHQTFEGLVAEGAIVVSNKKLFVKRLAASLAAACATNSADTVGCSVTLEKK